MQINLSAGYFFEVDQSPKQEISGPILTHSCLIRHARDIFYNPKLERNFLFLDPKKHIRP